MDKSCWIGAQEIIANLCCCKKNDDDVKNDVSSPIFELASFVTTDIFHILTVIVVLNTTLKDCTVSFTKLNTSLIIFSKKMETNSTERL